LGMSFGVIVNVDRAHGRSQALAEGTPLTLSKDQGINDWK
jgi:hypothetical protein